MTKRVNRYTRAPQEGRVIYCPKCGNGDRVYHFSWVAHTCQSCWQMIDKGDNYLEPPDKRKLPQPLPPVFIPDADDYWMLYNGDESYSGIAVELVGKPGSAGPCVVHDNGKTLKAPYIAAAKTMAMEILKARNSLP